MTDSKTCHYEVTIGWLYNGIHHAITHRLYNIEIVSTDLPDSFKRSISTGELANQTEYRISRSDLRREFGNHRFLACADCPENFTLCIQPLILGQAVKNNSSPEIIRHLLHHPAFPDNKPLTDFSLSASNLSQLDDSDDELLYQQPDFKDTYDQSSGDALRAIHASVLQPQDHVLDFMCGAQSYIPQGREQCMITGIGLNKQELQANQKLTNHTVQNVNKYPDLPYNHASFDVVLYTAAIEYLTNPLYSFRELRRVLKPSGKIVVNFTDFWVESKAIQLWSHLSISNRIQLSAWYLRQNGFVDIRSCSLTGLLNDPENDYTIDADSIFIVFANCPE